MPWGKKPDNPEPATRRIDFDFTFSKEERVAKRITRKELAALENYGGINTRKVTRRDFVKTRVKVIAAKKGWTKQAEPVKTVELELLQRLSGRIEARQYDTLKSLLGK